MNVNYRKEFEETIFAVKDLTEKPRLLLHSCCAPCSTSVIAQIKDFFDVTVYFYNPNIYPEDEYIKRLGEQKKLCKILGISLIEGEYVPADFYSAVRGREKDCEGGQRCKICCGLRLAKTAEKAKQDGFEYFTTTLSVSPLKNATHINEMGLELEKKYGVKFLVADFKKKDGYLNSIRLSKEYGLYRQNYCGCEFSKRKEE